jgi:hypothetical protein
MIGPTVATPVSGRGPDHPPVALQLVAATLVHVSVDDPFEGTEAGLAVSVTVIAACCTDTVAVCVTEPPEPVHVSE